MSEAPQQSRWVPRIPGPLQRLFDQFPLLTYDANALPSRAPAPSTLPTLYIFVSEDDALRGAPSFNPTCLKWQTFLKIAGVQLRLVPSTNHASPTGALPFLLPPGHRQPYSHATATASAPLPIPASKLQAYALYHGGSVTAQPPTPRLDAYQALLDTRLRNAWLHALYLDRANAGVLAKLYVAPASSVSAVRAALTHQLRRAAEAELAKSVSSAGTIPSWSVELSGVGTVQLPGGARPAPDPHRIYADARQAFEALEHALAEEGAGWFFGAAGPTLFDAAVFTYVHLMLIDERMPWTEDGRRWRWRRAEGTGKRQAPTSLLEDMVKTLDVPRLREHHRQLWTLLWPGLAQESGMQDEKEAEAESDADTDDDEGELVHLDEKVGTDIFDSVEHIDMTESLLQAR